MMKLITILAALLLLSAGAMSMPEQLTSGQYEFSFDLNTSLNYSVEVDNFTNETSPLVGIYGALVTFPETNASAANHISLAVNEYDSPQNTLLEPAAMYFRAMKQSFNNTSAEFVVVDGKDALLTNQRMQSGKEIIGCQYWLDAKKCDCGPVSVGRALVIVSGSLADDVPGGKQIWKNLFDSLRVRNVSTKEEVLTVKADSTTSMNAAIEPYIIVSNQNIVRGTVTIDEAYSNGPGWLVIHANDYRNPSQGTVIGYTNVSDGLNKDVVVTLNMAKVTRKLYAVLHQDGHTIGTFEYPGPDMPFTSKGLTVATFFNNWPTREILFDPTPYYLIQ